MLKINAQVVQVHLEPFRRSSLLKCVSQPKIAKKFTNTPTLGVQGHSRSSTLTPMKNMSPVLVILSSTSISIGNRFHATRCLSACLSLCLSVCLSFESKCNWKILRIGWTRKVTNEELYRKIQLAETLLQKVIQRKLRLFGHIYRMDDSRKIKTLVFRMMDGSNERGRPQREWSDDVEQWRGATLQELSHAALDRQRWAAIVTMASDTNGC